jgi:hypothetical protein
MSLRRRPVQHFDYTPKPLPDRPAPAAISVGAFPQSLLVLSDGCLAAIMAAAHPLRAAMKPKFFEAVAERLSRAGEVGEGTVARCCRDLQRAYLDPPDLSAGHPGKYE